MMKKTPRIILVFLAGASTVFASMPPVDVAVLDPRGKVAYETKTSSAGSFSTPKLQPGNYIVQFNSNSVKGNYVVVVSAGKKKVSAEGVPDEKFAKGGVGMKVEVGAGLNITGQIVEGSNDVKVVNGITYYWVKGGGTGSNLGGRWLTKEEARAQGINVGTFRKEAIQWIQEKSYNPQG
jgi:hypothetical protein